MNDLFKKYDKRFLIINIIFLAIGLLSFLLAIYEVDLISFPVIIVAIGLVSLIPEISVRSKRLKTKVKAYNVASIITIVLASLLVVASVASSLSTLSVKEGFSFEIIIGFALGAIALVFMIFNLVFIIQMNRDRQLKNVVLEEKNMSKEEFAAAKREKATAAHEATQQKLILQEKKKAEQVALKQKKAEEQTTLNAQKRAKKVEDKKEMKKEKIENKKPSRLYRLPFVFISLILSLITITAVTLRTMYSDMAEVNYTNRTSIFVVGIIFAIGLIVLFIFAIVKRYKIEVLKKLVSVELILLSSWIFIVSILFLTNPTILVDEVTEVAEAGIHFYPLGSSFALVTMLFALVSLILGAINLKKNQKVLFYITNSILLLAHAMIYMVPDFLTNHLIGDNYELNNVIVIVNIIVLAMMSISQFIFTNLVLRPEVSLKEIEKQEKFAARKSAKVAAKTKKLSEFEKLNLALNEAVAAQDFQKADELKKAIETYKETHTLEVNSYFDGYLMQLIGWNLLAGFLNLITLMIMFPFTMVWKMKWKAKHTVYDGKRLVFDGNGFQLWGRYLLWLLLAVVTLGIFALFIPIRIEKWKAKHTHLINDFK